MRPCREEKRFEKKSLHVHKKEAGHLSQLSDAPGFLYNPSVPSRPTIDKAARDKSMHGYKAGLPFNSFHVLLSSNLKSRFVLRSALVQ